jgi:phosphoglycolate phosphatase-like HAD superfamily hydrolase
VKYDAVIFDWDGVITQTGSIKTDAFGVMFEKYGPEVHKKVVDHQETSQGISRYKKFAYYFKEFLNKEISDEELAQLGDEFSHYVKQKIIECDLVDGAQETLDKLKQMNVPMFVATGTPTDESIDIAKARGMLGYFGKIYGSPQTKKEIVKEIIDTYGYNPENMLFFGDAMVDMEAAESANIQFIGIVEGKNIFPPYVKTQNKISI